jgi:hypothetical protein
VDFLTELFKSPAGIVAPIGVVLLVVSLVISSRQRKVAELPDDNPAKKSAGSLKAIGTILGIGCIACLAYTGLQLPTIMARAGGPSILLLETTKNSGGQLVFKVDFDPKRFETGTGMEIEMGADASFSQVWLKQQARSADVSKGTTTFTLPNWPTKDGYARLRKLNKDGEELAIGYHEYFMVP